MEGSRCGLAYRFIEVAGPPLIRQGFGGKEAGEAGPTGVEVGETTTRVEEASTRFEKGLGVRVDWGGGIYPDKICQSCEKNSTLLLSFL